MEGTCPCAECLLLSQGGGVKSSCSCAECLPLTLPWGSRAPAHVQSAFPEAGPGCRAVSRPLRERRPLTGSGGHRPALFSMAAACGTREREEAQPPCPVPSRPFPSLSSERSKLNVQRPAGLPWWRFPHVTSASRVPLYSARYHRQGAASVPSLTIEMKSAREVKEVTNQDTTFF